MPLVATKQSRKKSRVIYREMKYLEGIGQRRARIIANQITVEGLRAVRYGREPLEVIKPGIESFRKLLMTAMVTAHLTGRYRALVNVSPKLRAKQKGLATDSYAGAVQFMRQRMDITPEEYAELKQLYGDTALDVTRGLSSQLEVRSKQAMLESVQAGEHVSESMKKLREAFDAGGVTPNNPYLLENLVRTQTALAYSVGRWNVNSDPDIQEILWGYEYSTVGDDRVRPSHAGMEGTRLPKEDPFWEINWPPNGFSCRCTAIEIFKDQDKLATPQRPQPVVDKNGIEVMPGADKGWGFNPAIVKKEGLKTGPLKTKLLKAKKAILKAVSKPVKFKTREEWVKALTKEDKVIIERYTRFHAVDIAELQRKIGDGKITLETALKSKKWNEAATSMVRIEQLLDKAPGIERTIFRGMSWRGERGKAFKDFMVKLKQKEFTLPQISSFTTKKAVAESFANDLADHNARMVIKIKGGVSKRSIRLGKLADFDYRPEAEVLVGSGPRYRVVKMTSKRSAVNPNRIWHTVEIEEIL